MAKEKRHRVQVDFSPQTFAKLQRLKKSRDASSIAEVIRHAVDALDWIDDKKKRRTGILLRKEDGEIREVEFPLL